MLAAEFGERLSEFTNSSNDVRPMPARSAHVFDL